MKSMQKMKVLKGALALAAVLALASTAWAKKNGNGPGIPGVFVNGNRTSVTVEPTVDLIPTCDPNITTQSYSVKAYIFQPSGRLLAIGIGTSDTFTCSNSTPQTVEVTVDAVPGLTFKPGPATLLYQVILTDSTDLTMPPIVTVVSENGSRVDLH
jgi:hypothetical protein